MVGWKKQHMEKRAERKAARPQKRESAGKACRRCYCYGARTLLLPEVVRPCAWEDLTLAAVPEVSQKHLLPAVAGVQEEEGHWRTKP